MNRPLAVIAIDGPSGSGKSITAREVARRLGWQHIDTGAMYRALALAVIRCGLDPADAEAVGSISGEAGIELRPGSTIGVLLDGEDVSEAVRSPEISRASSLVSAHPLARKRMAGLQRELGLRSPSVLEGRDIGSVIFPDAGLKVYLDANLEQRARRRLSDYRRQGRKASYEDVIADLAMRDKRDTTRSNSPLKVAPGAKLVDTSKLTIEEQVERVIEMAREVFGEEVAR